MISDSLRSSVACQYLKGEGIEIGALHSPLKVPSHARIRYLDRMPTNLLKQTYPELLQHNLVEVDIVDDGEILSSVPDTSVDFIIANHMIEHCQNPIFSLKNWLRVVKPGGILYIAVPDKRHTFDCERPVTTLEHLLRDYTEGPGWSKNAHFEEWARLVDKYPEPDVEGRALGLAALNYSIHFHVWTQMEFAELLIHCRSRLSLPFEIELLQKNGEEFIAILSKVD
jgi:SAM-dependent methyltransferase